MMANHYFEKELDLFAQEITKNKNSQVLADNEHLKNCERCKSQLNFLLNFYENFNKELESEVDKRVEQLAKSLSESKIIQLYPFKVHLDIESLTNSNHTSILAAETTEIKAHRYSTRATFASESKNILVRIVDDSIEHKYNIYLLSESPEFSKESLIGFQKKYLEDFSYVSTDVNGKANVEYHEEIDWVNNNLIILSPLVEISHEEIYGNQTFTKDNFNFTIRDKEKSIEIVIESKFEKVTKALIIYSDNKYSINQIDFGVLEINLEPEQKISRIKFFN